VVLAVVLLMELHQAVLLHQDKVTLVVAQLELAQVFIQPQVAVVQEAQLPT